MSVPDLFYFHNKYVIKAMSSCIIFVAMTQNKALQLNNM